MSMCKCGAPAMGTYNHALVCEQCREVARVKHSQTQLRRRPLMRKIGMKLRVRTTESYRLAWTAPYVPVSLEDELDDLCRKVILIRDGFVCRKCGQGPAQHGVRVKLDAHHILTKGSHPELRWEIGNLVSLCRLCHSWFHDGATPEADKHEWLMAHVGDQILAYLRQRVIELKGTKLDRYDIKRKLLDRLGMASTE